MAINLITGLPGSAKTLYTLFTVEARRIADNKALYDKWVEAGSDEENPPHQRNVYYYNIPLYRHKLPSWIKLEKPDDWVDCPNGHIFVFDECQEAFEPLNNSEKRPKYYTELSKHRHRGHDMYFMTQHPTYVDTYVRKNTEEHTHIMRTWGAQTCVLHVWKGVKDNCDKTRKDSQQTRFTYPKHVYEWYRSSFLHTYKRKIPKQVFYILFAIVAIAGCVYGVVNYFNKKIDITKAENAKTATSQALGSVPVVKASFDPADYVPRISDLPHTAPRYDDLTQPSVAPRIVGCMVYQSRCKCMTQQGTYHISSMQFCLATIENGLFQDFEDSGGSGSSKSSQEQPKIEQSKPSPAPAPEIANKPESGFNLPIKSPDVTLQAQKTEPSGNMYPVRIPPGGVMYRAQ
jgi:hypothetical protein